MYIESIIALLALSSWDSQRKTSATLARLDTALRPGDPAADAAAKRRAAADMAAWQKRDRAERACAGRLTEAEAYEDFLTDVRARIVAHNTPAVPAQPPSFRTWLRHAAHPWGTIAALLLCALVMAGIGTVR